MTENKNRLFRRDRLIWVLLLILLVERLLLFCQFGPEYMSHSDDDAYLASGLFFAQTGVIAIDGLPGALTMPGMAVTIGLVSLIVGDGSALLITLKLIWILMGVLTAYTVYRTVTIFCSEWAGLFAAAHFLLPNMAWMNHVILTETPYMLFFAMSILYTFRMGEDNRTRNFVFYTLSIFLALMFRSNIITMPLFTAAYLLIRKKNPRQFLRRGMCFAAAMLLFFVPWTLRNYRQFGAFIPLTYGAGDPVYLGTYQGENTPDDRELDYETNVISVLKDKYADYYDENGNIKESQHRLFLYSMERKLRAQYRMREWWKSSPLSMLKSYLYIKPRLMLNWVWAWEEAFHVPYQVLHRFSQLNLLFCALTLVLCLILKEYRLQVLFLTAVYGISVYIYSFGYVTDRYASTLILLRYLIAGFGAALLGGLAVSSRKRGKGGLQV